MKLFKSKEIVSPAILSASLTIVYITLVTIYSELNHDLKDFLKDTFGHHWVGKGITSMVLFIILIWLFSYLKGTGTSKGSIYLLKVLSLTTVLGSIALYAFFVYEASL